jgi:hypothetical protein
MTRRQPGLLFLAACMAALALRLVLPSGWMPAAWTEGPMLTLCSGAVLPLDTGAPSGDPDQPCGFAVALGPALAAAVLLLAMPALRVLLPVLPMPVPPRARRHRLRPPGQGPPRP